MRLGNFTLVSGGSGVSCVKTVSGTPESSFSLGILVRIAGLEPARLAVLPPQSSVSANSTISANRGKLQHATAWTQVHSGLQNSIKRSDSVRDADKVSPEYRLILRRRYDT